MRLEHVGIYANDSASLAAWYTRTLRLKEIRRIERDGRPPVVFLQGDGGAVVEILPTKATAAERALDSPGYSHLGIVVSDLTAVSKDLADQGIEVAGIRETSNGWKIGYFRDPEGNILELVQR